MKTKKYKLLMTIIAAVFVFSTCDKLPMEESQDAYDATKVVPMVLGMTGPGSVLQTKTYTFGVNYVRAGSTWAWTGENCTVSSVSEDTRSASVLFNVLPAEGTLAKITVIETTAGGVASSPKSLEVTVNPFCPLANGIDDLVGSWSGSDAGYTSEFMTLKESDVLKGKGMGVGFIEDFWAENVIEEGNFTITINDDGTVDIPRQYVFKTIYEGDNYDYEIAGSGTWDNCGATPEMVIKYDIYYPDDAKGLAATYASYLDNIPYLTAEIQLDASKSGYILRPPVNSPRKK